LAYQKGRREEQKLSEKEIEVKKTLCEKGQIEILGASPRPEPGIKQHSLKWLCVWINQELVAYNTFFLLAHNHIEKRTHKSRAESRIGLLSCVFAERKIRKHKSGGRKSVQDMII